MSRHDDHITYQSVRRWPRRGLYSRLTIAVGEVIEPTALEVWLTARWGAHTRKAGRTWWVPNEHGPWPLRAAEVAELSNELWRPARCDPSAIDCVRCFRRPCEPASAVPALSPDRVIDQGQEYPPSITMSEPVM